MKGSLPPSNACHPLWWRVHPLADEYVTDLLVRVVPVDAMGRRMQETVLPVVYAIWLDGFEDDATGDA